jgi:hypothetical protein
VTAAEVPPRLAEALADLVAWLKRDGIPHVIIGGVAVAVVGHPRTTRDIDAVILMEDRSWESLIGLAKNAGFEARVPEPAAFARQSRVFLLRHAKTRVDVDLSAGALPFEEEVVKRASLKLLGGRPVPVATPEDLIVMKIIASRPRDIADIEGLLASNPSLDLKRVRKFVRLFADALESPERWETLERLLGPRGRA